jgi:hypothetical protein
MIAFSLQQHVMVGEHGRAKPRGECPTVSTGDTPQGLKDLPPGLTA